MKVSAWRAGRQDRYETVPIPDFSRHPGFYRTREVQGLVIGFSLDELYVWNDPSLLKEAQAIESQRGLFGSQLMSGHIVAPLRTVIDGLNLRRPVLGLRR